MSMAVARSPLLFPTAALAVLASIALLLVEIFAIGSICLLCEGVHVLAVLVLLAGWRMHDAVELRWYAARPREWASDLAIPVVAIVALRLATPPYWTRTSLDDSFARGVDEQGRPWIGAEEPEVVLHEYVDYACPHCAVATVHTRIRLARHPDELRIVRHHQPRIRCTPARRSWSNGLPCWASWAWGPGWSSPSPRRRSSC